MAAGKFRIVPKRDFPRIPYSHAHGIMVGNELVSRGFIIKNENGNVLLGGEWFLCIADAMVAVRHLAAGRMPVGLSPKRTAGLYGVSPHIRSLREARAH